MSRIFDEVMQKLYGHNIWDGFVPNADSGEVQGWNGTHPSLSRVLSHDKPQIIVDVGVWKGQSTITLANNIKKHAVNGVVIAVDTFLGSAEHWPQEQNFFGRTQGLPDLYRTFLSNVYAAGLSDVVIPMAQTSTTGCIVLRHLGIRPTLVHVDAAHEYREVLRDVEDYWDVLDEDGFLIGDDYHETWPGVVKAANEFAARVHQRLKVEQPKFILQKSDATRSVLPNWFRSKQR